MRTASCSSSRSTRSPRLAIATRKPRWKNCGAKNCWRGCSRRLEAHLAVLGNGVQRVWVQDFEIVALVLDEAASRPVAQVLVDTFTGRPDEVSQFLLRQLQFDPH